MHRCRPGPDRSRHSNSPGQNRVDRQGKSRGGEVKKAYLAVKGLLKDNSDVVIDILGIFEFENDAIQRCLNQKSCTRSSWRRTPEDKNRWENGSGMYVSVTEHVIE